jgi:hypothetical protein
VASATPGFDTSRVSPSDAIVTLRSLRRRFAEAFDQAEDAEVLSRRPAGGLSPLEHVVWTATALEAIGSALGRVLVADDPAVTLPAVEPSGPVGGATGGAATVLARLGDVAHDVADAMAEVHGDTWTRTGRAPTGEVTALDIARLAVRVSVEHLRATERTLALS